MCLGTRSWCLVRFCGSLGQPPDHSSWVAECPSGQGPVAALYSSERLPDRLSFRQQHSDLHLPLASNKHDVATAQNRQQSKYELVPNAHASRQSSFNSNAQRAMLKRSPISRHLDLISIVALAQSPRGNSGSGKRQHSAYAPDQFFRRTDHDPPSALHKKAFPLPLAQQPADRKYRDVRLVSQFLITDIDYGPLKTFLPHSFGQLVQHMRNPLTGAVITRCNVEIAVSGQIVRRNQQRIFKQSWIFLREGQDCTTVPDQSKAIRHGLCAQQIIHRFGQQCPSTRDLSRWNPEKYDLFSFTSRRKRTR